MSQQDQKRFNSYFPNQRLLAYEPAFAILFNSVTTSIFLGQLIYWNGKGARKDGWIFKTTQEMYKETGLTRDQQETAIRNLKSHGLLETKLAQVPAKRHFKLDLTHLKEVIPSLADSHNLIYWMPPSSIPANPQSITETISETTTKTTGAPLSSSDYLAQRRALVRKRGV